MYKQNSDLQQSKRGCSLSTGYPMFDKEILKIVEKSVTPWKEKIYGRKG